MVDVQLYCGDCLEVMKGMEDNSVDSIVTDPPYGLKFMGKKWDYDVPSVEVWEEVLRVLKPGGHLLSFGGTRTYHRMVVNIEDAGFEIRDQLQWLYGSGFPKSHNISKAIDRMKGAERTEGKRVWKGGKRSCNSFGGGSGQENGTTELIKYDAPATPEAEQWDGWGTALKPAHEPICLARKPLAERTIAGNVLEWGTGGINIDGCRAGTESHIVHGKEPGKFQPNGGETIKDYHAVSGRFPANVILDEEAGRMLDEQSGTLKSGTPGIKRGGNNGFAYGAESRMPGTRMTGFGDKGGASRFFYCAKASRSERNAGLIDPGARRKRNDTTGGKYAEAPNPPGSNHHPTVKPISLIRYLCRLITPPGGVILDPYAGSFTTGCGAVLEGFSFVGIDREAEYLEIGRRRIAYYQAEAQMQPALL